MEEIDTSEQREDSWAKLAAHLREILENTEKTRNRSDDDYHSIVALTLPIDLLFELKDEYRKDDGIDPCYGALEEICNSWLCLLDMMDDLTVSRERLSAEQKKDPESLSDQRKAFKKAIVCVLGKIEDKAHDLGLKRRVGAFRRSLLIGQSTLH